jgi:hypothetical protein
MAVTKNKKALVAELKKMVKDLPIEVLGHIEAPALCCGNGTVAVVKVDKGDPAPLAKKRK